MNVDFLALCRSLECGESRADALWHALVVSAVGSSEAVSVYFPKWDEHWWHEGVSQPFGHVRSGHFRRITPKWWLERVHPDDQARMIAERENYFRKLPRNQSEHAFRFRSRRGDDRDVVVSTMTVFDAEDRYVASVSIYRDVTASVDARRALEDEIAAARQAEQALRHESRERQKAQKILQKQSQALEAGLELLLRQPTFEAFLRATLRRVTRESGGCWARCWLVDDEGLREVATYFIHSSIRVQVEAQESRLSGPTAILGPELSRILEEGRVPVVISADDPRIPLRLRKGNAKMGVQSIWISPFWLGKELLGWIACFHPLPNAEPDLLAFLSAISQQLAVAYQVARLRDSENAFSAAQERERTAQRRENEQRRIEALLRQVDAVMGGDDCLETILSDIVAVQAQLFESDEAQLWTRMGRDRVPVLSRIWRRTEAISFATEVRAAMEGATTKLVGDFLAALALADRPLSMPSDTLQLLRLFRSMAAWHRPVKSSDWLVLPLVFRAESEGFLLIATDAPAHGGEVRMSAGRALAQQAALAIHMASVSELRQRSGLARERNRIARDLHDVVAQTLSGIVLQIEALRAENVTLPEAVLRRLEKITSQAQRSANQVRTTLRMLRPVALEDHDLFEALGALAAESDGARGISVVFHSPPPRNRLPSAVAAHLFAIASEALHNALQHAEPTRIEIFLASSQKQVLLTIKDNGRGLSREHLAGLPGHGFANMRERAKCLGGRLSIESTEAGLMIRARIPVSVSVG